MKTIPTQSDPVNGGDLNTPADDQAADPKLVPVWMPHWIAKRLEQTAKIIGNEGGVPEMLEYEFGCQLLGPHCSFHDVILDREEGTWQWEEGEYEEVKSQLKALGLKWEQEDRERESQAAATMEAGGAQ